MDNKLPESYETHGVLKRESFLALEKGILPESWCGDVGGRDLIIVKDDEARELEKQNKHYDYVRAKWNRPALDSLGYLVEVVKDLKNIAYNNDVDYDKVRIVFGFDS